MRPRHEGEGVPANRIHFEALRPWFLFQFCLLTAATHQEALCLVVGIPSLSRDLGLSPSGRVHAMI